MYLACNYSIPARQNLPGQRSGGNIYGDDFAFIMQTDAANETVKLRGNGATGVWYDYDIDWGDGTTETYLNVQTVTHTYTDAGDYIIRISGQYGGFRSDNTTYTTRKITEVLNWGKTCFYTFNYMFNDQPRLTSIPDIIAYDWTESSIGPAPATAQKQFIRAFSSNVILPNPTGPKLTRCVIKDTEFDTLTDIFRGNIYCEYLEISNCTQKLLGTSGSSNPTYYVGTQVTDGCEVVLKDITFNPSINLDLTGFLRRVKFKSLTIDNIDCSNFTNPAGLLTLRYFFEGCDFPQDEDVVFDMRLPLTDADIDFDHFAYYITGSPNTLDFSQVTTGPSGRINTYDMSYFHNQDAVTSRSTGFRFIDGLNKFKASSGRSFFGLYGFRYAQRLVFPKNEPSKNWASDFMHSGVTSGSNIGNFFQLHGFDYPGETSPNCADWDTSSVTNLNACFYRVDFDGSFSLNWDVSNCPSFYAMFFLGECTGTNTQLDLSGVTWPSTLASVRFDQVFQNSNFGEIIMSSFPSNIYTVQRAFDNNDDLDQVAFNTLDFSNITTSSDDNSRVTWDRNPTMSAATYAGLLSSMKTLTQPVTAPQGGMVQDVGSNVMWESGNLYVGQSHKGPITVPTGSTTITDTSATFVSDGVVAGDIYVMQSSTGTNRSYYIIQSVSQTQLTLTAPTVSNQQYYRIFTSQSAKDYAANYTQNGGKFRVIVDGGPIIN